MTGVHGLVDLLDRQSTVNLLHGLAGLLHRLERLLVDVGRFDRVDLLLERRDLSRGLFEGMFVLFLSFQRRSCRYISPRSVSVFQVPFRKCLAAGKRFGQHAVSYDETARSPFLFELTVLRAIASCSSIWFCRCCSRFCNISRCARKATMASLGAALRFWDPPPVIHDSIPDMVTQGQT